MPSFLKKSSVYEILKYLPVIKTLKEESYSVF